MKNHIHILVLFFLLLSGCTSKSITSYPKGEKKIRISQAKRYKIIWAEHFRKNQKDYNRRIDYIENALQSYFAANNRVMIYREDEALLASDYTLFSKARKKNIDEIVLLEFREVGPTLNFYLSPILWSTNNIIELGYKVYDVKHKSIKSNVSIVYRRGGPFTLHSAEELPIDLKETLDEIFHTN